MSINGGFYVPTTQATEEPSPCKRGCCWTPYNLCPKARQCPCHWGKS